jgi:hypothetical protein
MHEELENFERNKVWIFIPSPQDGTLSHPDLRGKPGCVSYVRQRKTTHIMTKCIEINVTNIIT